MVDVPETLLTVLPDKFGFSTLVKIQDSLLVQGSAATCV